MTSPSVFVFSPACLFSKVGQGRQVGLRGRPHALGGTERKKGGDQPVRGISVGYTCHTCQSPVHPGISLVVTPITSVSREGERTAPETENLAPTAHRAVRRTSPWAR